MASHPNPRGDAVNRMGIGVGVVLAVVVGLRFLARWRSKASFAADDWFIAASLVPLYGMIVTASFSMFLLTFSMGHSRTDLGTQWSTREEREDTSIP